MYLIDNLGNRYDHFDGGGSAYASVVMHDGIPTTGWFTFGPPPAGAYNFDFYDDDNLFSVKWISLVYPTILYEKIQLQNYPLVLEYLKETWEPVTLGDGSVLMQHKNLPDCTLQEKPPAEPEGKYKNTLQIGEVTYEIYGYFDAVAGYYVREYLAVDGLTNLEGVKSFFYVTIPSVDTSTTCIMDVSGVLARVANLEP